MAFSFGLFLHNEKVKQTQAPHGRGNHRSPEKPFFLMLVPRGGIVVNHNISNLLTVNEGNEANGLRVHPGIHARAIGVKLAVKPDILGRTHLFQDRGLIWGKLGRVYFSYSPPVRDLGSFAPLKIRRFIAASPGSHQEGHRNKIHSKGFEFQ
jgi:hypothetical protein